MTQINRIANGSKKLAVAAMIVVVTFGLGATSASAYVLGPTTPGKWGGSTFGTGATVTYSFMADGVSCAAEFLGCTITSFATLFSSVSGWQTAVTNSFAAWSSVANLTFSLVADDGAAFNAATVSGDIRLGAHTFDGPGGNLAHGFYPPANGVGDISAAGDIHFDSSETWKVGFGGSGFDIFQVLTHELGHALGLNHTAVTASLMNPFYSEAFTGPQADDIAGMQHIYGVTPVPEPEIYAMLGIGLGLMGFVARRKKPALQSTAS